MLKEKEYQQIKEMEMKRSIETVAKIQEDSRPYVKYKDSRPITDIKHMIETSVGKYPEHTAFYQKFTKGGEYEKISYTQMLKDMNSLGTALIEAGLKDKKIAIIGENSYFWAISYLAVVCGTGIAVPLDKELSDKELKNLILQSEVSAIIFTEKYEKLFREIRESRESCLELLINMDITANRTDVISWHRMRDEGAKLIEKGNREFLDAQIIADELAVILFTSGTTGVSKGVMLSHKNIVADLMVAPTVLKVNDWDIFFSVLPIHHTYECTCGFLMPIYKGAAIAYCEGLKYITTNLKEVKPTMFLGVPVLFENLHKKIWQNVRKKGKENTLKKVIKINAHTKKIGIDLGNKFFKDIRAVFGGRMRMMICGGAAINPEVLEGIQDFGIM
ncbi:MAG: AMP-binding protein, partial [Anaerovoracaceae bacterium]